MIPLRTQLIMIIGVVVFSGIAALLGLAGSQVTTLTMNAFINEKQTVAVVASSSLITNQGPNGDGDNSDKSDRKGKQVVSSTYAQNVLNASASSTGTNFSYLDTKQNVIATTQADQFQITAAGEVAKAEQGTIATAVRDNSLYIAVPLFHDQQVIGVLWAAASLAPVQAQLRVSWLTPDSSGTCGDSRCLPCRVAAFAAHFPPADGDYQRCRANGKRSIGSTRPSLEGEPRDCDP